MGDMTAVAARLVDVLLTLTLDWAVPDAPGRRPVEWLALAIVAVAVAAVGMWRRGITLMVAAVPLLALLLMYPPLLQALPVVIALR